MQKDLDFEINKATPLYYLMAYYLLCYIEYNYVYKDKNKLENSSKIDTFLTNIEDLINLKNEEENGSYNRQKLNQLKHQLDRFELFKECKDSEKIMFFMFEIIRDLAIWSDEIVAEQLKKRFIDFNL